VADNNAMRLKLVGGVGLVSFLLGGADVAVVAIALVPAAAAAIAFVARPVRDERSPATDSWLSVGGRERIGEVARRHR
jgi:hypothetical protein